VSLDAANMADVASNQLTTPQVHSKEVSISSDNGQKQKNQSFFGEDDDDDLVLSTPASSSSSSMPTKTVNNSSTESKPGQASARGASSSWIKGMGGWLANSVGKVAGALRRRSDPNIKRMRLDDDGPKPTYIEGRGWVFGDNDGSVTEDPAKAPPPTSMPVQSNNTPQYDENEKSNGNRLKLLSPAPSALDKLIAPPSANRYAKQSNNYLDALMAPPSASGRYGITKVGPSSKSGNTNQSLQGGPPTAGPPHD
jgi:hypothetical protein